MKITPTEYHHIRNTIIFNEPGVGILLEGIPNNYAEFIDILEDEACPPIIARHILDDLIRNGSRMSTLRASLNFIKLELNLLSVGITLTIIKPINSDHHQKRHVFLSNAYHEIVNNKIPTNVEIQQNEEYLKEIKLGKEMFEKYGSVVNRKWRN